MKILLTSSVKTCFKAALSGRFSIETMHANFLSLQQRRCIELLMLIFAPESLNNNVRFKCVKEKRRSTDVIFDVDRHQSKRYKR